MSFNGKGAATGAVSGASIGTAITPGWGTAIGAVAGGLLGGFLLPEDTSPEDAEALINEHQRMVDELSKRLEAEWQLPSGVATPLTFEEFKLLARYNPVLAREVIEQKPETINESGSQEEIAVQRQALGEYSRLAATGVDPISEAQQAAGLAKADAHSRSLRNEVLSNYSRAGLGNSGQGYIASLMAGQEQDSNRRQESLQAAAAAEERRRHALGSAAGLAGQIRGQNMNVEQVNANINNVFNQRNTMNKQAFEIQRANTLNQASQYNIQNAQNVADKNVQLRNNTHLLNTQRAENAAQDLRDSQNEKLKMVVGTRTGNANTALEQGAGVIQAKAARDAALNNLILQGGLAIGSTAAAYNKSQPAAPASAPKAAAPAVPQGFDMLGAYPTYASTESAPPPDPGFYDDETGEWQSTTPSLQRLFNKRT